MKNIFMIVLTIISVKVFSQSSVDSVLFSVERNNTTLSAFKKKMEAEKIENKTNLLPPGPEAEFNYLWGKPLIIGNRTDISIKQSFDFPTAYTYRSKISELKNVQAELEYENHRREILLHARLLCVELTYHNALRSEYSKRLDNARQIAEAYKKMFETGETSILEFNKAKIHLTNLMKDLENIGIERSSLLAELARLNGGTAITFVDSVFTETLIISDFEKWYLQAERNNPMLQWLNQEVTITQKQQQLQRAQNMPKLSGGYMSEKVVGEQYQGVSLGLVIPLWENKNTLKFAKVKAQAVEEIKADSRLQFYNEMKILHSKVLALQNSTENYRAELLQYNNREFLEKALGKGEISLSEYLVELSVYYESIDKLLDMERNMNKARSELLSFGK